MASDIGEMYKSLNEYKKNKHQIWHTLNTEILDNSGIKYKKTSHECYIFRSEKVKADFFPSTGRWKKHGQQKVLSGGADQFLKWWRWENENTRNSTTK